MCLLWQRWLLQCILHEHHWPLGRMVCDAQWYLLLLYSSWTRVHHVLSVAKSYCSKQKPAIHTKTSETNLVFQLLVNIQIFLSVWHDGDSRKQGICSCGATLRLAGGCNFPATYSKILEWKLSWKLAKLNCKLGSWRQNIFLSFNFMHQKSLKLNTCGQSPQHLQFLAINKKKFQKETNGSLF